MSKNRFVMYLVFMALFCGCDPSIGYEYYVSNSSDSTLAVSIKYNGRSPNDTLKFIAPRHKEIICEFTQFGSSPHDEGEDFLENIELINITSINGSKIKKDIHRRDSWTYDNDISYFLLIKVGTNKYTINIENDDF